ncbi:hypothetical protein [Acinetobacter sp. NIPH 298]|uniref:hypothetical protein n=1 Tax=Acinetobacter sp. NIPH 298 TaxID=1217692 RepID=UPI0002D133AD|nr:hypothetical protein [Acinetobacter sp. NIPH 298]ENW97795.1 hypothetical protein F903_00318 [Acinetobacter sp. NIPH 298]
MDFQEKISNDNFFKLMKHRIPSSSSRPTSSAFGEGIIFKETIDALRLFEKFALEIKEGVWEEDSISLKLENPENKKQYDELLYAFNDLRLNQYLLPHPEMFNHLFFQSVYKAYKLIDQLPKVDLKKSVLPIIPYVRDKIDKGIQRQFELEKNASNDLSQQTEAFDNLLRRHKSVYVLVLDIYIESFFKSLLVSAVEFQEIKRRQIEQLHIILAQLAPLHGITKIETHFKDGLNLHCILMLKPTKDFSEKNTIEVLKQKIQHDMGGLHVDIRNWNTVIEKIYSKIAVGLIKKSQTKNIEAFKYWILSFFYILDLHIKPYLPDELKNYLVVNGYLDYYINTVKEQREKQQSYMIEKSQLNALKKLSKALPKVCIPPISDKAQKTIWATRHLPKTSQGYIDAISHYYQEIESDEKKRQLIIRIEVFIETLVTSRFEAFDLSVSPDQEQLTWQILNRAITRLGQQLIELAQVQIVDLDHPRYTLLAQVFNAASFRNINQQLIGPYINRKTIEQVNEMITKLRQLYITPFESLDKKSILAIKTQAYKKYKKRLDTAIALFQHLMKQDCRIFRVTIEVFLEFEHIPLEKLTLIWTAFLHHAQRSKPLFWKTGYLGLWRLNDEQHFYADVFIVFDERVFTSEDLVIQQLNDQWSVFIKNKASSKLGLKESQKMKSYRIQGKSIMAENVEYSSNSLLIDSTNSQRKSEVIQKIIPTFLSRSIFEEGFLESFKETNTGILMKSSIAVAKKKKIK